MEEKNKLINEICKKQNFEEILLDIKYSNRNKKITNVLQTLEDNKDIEDSVKRRIFEEIFDYIYDINKCYEDNIKKIFILGIEETLKQIYENDVLEKKSNNLKKRKKV